MMDPTLSAAFAASKSTLEPSLPSTAGVKRPAPAPSLLPPFELLSSSPILPRPLKRRETSDARIKYPTPLATSSTSIFSSSPPRHVGVAATLPGPTIERTQLIASERAPLSAVASVELNENGDTLLMGRSSNSSHYQLSANRLISRVHVKARYVAATHSLEPNKMEITCSGWNGVRLHCQGCTWELSKGDTFTSETEGAEIMLDVQDTRVMIQWPRCSSDRDALEIMSGSSWDHSPSRAPRNWAAVSASGAPSGSRLRRSTRYASPDSPTPARSSPSKGALHDFLSGGSEHNHNVRIYEDGSSDEPEEPKCPADPGQNIKKELLESLSSELSEPQSDGDKDPDEENDPIVHSFGPFGANLSNRLASFTTDSPRPQECRGSSSPPSFAPFIFTAGGSLSLSRPTSDLFSAKSKIPQPPPALVPAHSAVITNHVINQLAFSRLSSTPLSTIMSNLPAEKKDWSKDALRSVIESASCIGIISRHGKDAAGKPLESEYYYVSEKDPDDHRRLAVTDGLKKPSLRACRKQHKQYFWKRPKTP